MSSLLTHSYISYTYPRSFNPNLDLKATRKFTPVSKPDKSQATAQDADEASSTGGIDSSHNIRRRNHSPWPLELIMKLHLEDNKPVERTIETPTFTHTYSN